MLSKEVNDLLTQVGPGTPMGTLMRRYWLPALHDWELPEPDCPPIRLKLLGEQLVAFRATDGRVGVLGALCPHRRASLFLGRNEENGLRCIYHGWKFDVDGQCIDQLNEPVPFSAKIRTTAYPTIEVGGVIWVYMGPKEKQPPPPAFEWTQVPESHRTVTKAWQESNWLQALEGGVDTSHAPILHRALVRNPRQPGVPTTLGMGQGSAPRLEVELTDYGYWYFGIRSVGTDRRNLRGYHFIMPFTQLRPGGETKQNETHGHHWVPIDDENCLVWNWYYRYDSPLSEEEARMEQERTGNSYTRDVDIHNEFRSYLNKRNNWGIDRELQKTDTFTGIYGINTQDRATQESMGPIVDRAGEHLGPADKAVIETRKLLQRCIQIVEDGGDPPGITPTYYDLRGAEQTLPIDADWKQEMLRLMRVREPV